MPTLVQHFLEETADRTPEKTALICEGQRLTYVEFEKLANQFAHGLTRLGVSRGDRVGILLPNSIKAAIAIFAILKAGGVFVVLNPTTKPEKVADILENSRAAALITDYATAASGLLQGGRMPSLKGVISCGIETDTVWARNGSINAPMAEFPTKRPVCSNIDLDLACLIYTSGSTGEPKGVMCDHSNMIFVSGSVIQYLGNTADDIILNVLPLSFGYGLYQLLMAFRFGGTLVLEKSFAFPAAILKLMEKEKVTGFPSVPTMYALLIPMDLSGFNLSNLRYLTNAAAALPLTHITEIRKKFPQAKLFSMHGLTEVKRTLYLPPEMLEHKPGSVGIPIPGTECWLINEQGERLPNGSTGEMVVRGRHVMRGYWEAPEMTALRYRSGSIPGERIFHSGDIFRTDEDGYFYFVSRKDDIIKCRGEKVAPKEVETILYQLPGVANAVVIGVPDPVLGQAIKAILVVPGGSLTVQEVLAHCRAHLEDYMMPKHVEFRDSLPLNASGKIDKRALA